MKIIYSSFPDWFWESKTFQLEENPNHSNYKSVKERVFDYDTFPNITPPTNKFAGHGEYRYDLMKAQENDSIRHDPSERIGYTHFPRFNGLLPGQNNAFFNAYPTSKQVKFANEAGSVSNNTLTMSPQQEDQVWINGEMGIGYSVNSSDAAEVKAMIDGLKVAKPNSRYGIYSLLCFPIWGLFYDAITDINKADILCNLLNNPPTSTHEDCGMDYLLEDLYSLSSTNTQIFTAIGIFTKQLARKKYELTGKSIYNDVRFLIWSHTENLGFGFNYIKNTGEMISAGEIDGLSKAPANPEHNYNVALYGLTGADGILSFIDRFTTFGDVNINGVIRDLEKENVDGTDAGVEATLLGQFYKVAPALIPSAVNNMIVSIALWQTSLVRDIIDSTVYDWFTPDFTYNGNFRTGKYKQVPYNIFYKEPTFEVKFNDDKSKALIYAANLADIVPTTPIQVMVHITDTIIVPVVLKGNKAELIKVDLSDNIVIIPPVSTYKSFYIFNQKYNNLPLPTNNSDFGNNYLKVETFSHGISRNITIPQDIGVICKFEYEILNANNEVVISCKDNYGGFHPNFRNDISAESYYRVWTPSHSDYNSFQWVRDYYNNFTTITPINTGITPTASAQPFFEANDRGNNHFSIYSGYLPINTTYTLRIKNTGTFSFELRAGTIDDFDNDNNPSLADIRTTIQPNNMWYNFALPKITYNNNNDGSTKSYKINCYNH